MKNNKGFTLIELLAVIAIISILAGIGVIQVTKLISSSQKKTYKNFEKNLQVGAKDYFTVHTDLLVPGGDSYTVPGDELHDGGYLDNLIDPVNKEECDYNNSWVETTAKFDTTESFNVTYTYKVCLVCPNYKSPDC